MRAFDFYLESGTRAEHPFTDRTLNRRIVRRRLWRSMTFRVSSRRGPYVG